MPTDLTTLTPAEVDALWITETEPLRRLYAQRNDLMTTSRRYEKAGGSYAATAQRYYERALELDAKIAEARLAEEPFKAEWSRRGGWTRAYLVPDGHIHRATSCSSLHPTTIISWLPEQSGMDEDEIVAAAGVHACTICYPTAPVEALRAAEAAEKAEGECPGSRGYGHTGFRQTSYKGSGRATCNHCGERVGVTTSGKMRAHPKEN